MFQPRYIKHSHLLIRHAEKLIRYRRDRLSAETIVELQAQIEKVRTALKARDNRAAHEESERLDALLDAHTPPHKDAVWRENVEVILVAIVVAVGIRSYFIQPFKIPTGSMQPTLNGIIGHPSTEPAPNFLTQIVDFVVLGRNYINVVSGDENIVERVTSRKFLFFFTLSRIECDRQSFTVYAPPEILRQDFQVYPGNRYHRGQIMARGAIDTGDQVFVDKFSYNFVHPHRGDVFVFRTNHIPGIREDPDAVAGLHRALRYRARLHEIDARVREVREFGAQTIVIAMDIPADPRQRSRSGSGRWSSAALVREPPDATSRQLRPEFARDDHESLTKKLASE